MHMFSQTCCPETSVSRKLDPVQHLLNTEGSPKPVSHAETSNVLAVAHSSSFTTAVASRTALTAHLQGVSRALPLPFATQAELRPEKRDGITGEEWGHAL